MVSVNMIRLDTRTYPEVRPNPRTGKIQALRWSLLFFGVNLVSLILISIVAFRANEATLLNGLDGAYVMAEIRQQAEWGAGPPWGFTSNLLQSLGNVWMPHKLNLIPEYAIPRIWNHGGPAPVASYVVFAAEAFLSAYVVGLCLGRGISVASVAGRSFALIAMPYFGSPKVYPSPSKAVERFSESSCLAPRSPYAASKAAADHLAQAYVHTHGLDLVITRSCNNYGPYQHPEKLIPLMITNALDGSRLPVYGDGLHVRDWLHVRDHCRGIERALVDGRAGGVYNFGAREEHTNLDVVRMILRQMGLSSELIEFVQDRAGHDRRYGIDPSKAEHELGWRAEIPFAEGLDETVRWYRDHREWWEHTRAGGRAPAPAQVRTERP